MLSHTRHNGSGNTMSTVRYFMVTLFSNVRSKMPVPGGHLSARNYSPIIKIAGDSFSLELYWTGSPRLGESFYASGQLLVNDVDIDNMDCISPLYEGVQIVGVAVKLS